MEVGLLRLEVWSSPVDEADANRLTIHNDVSSECQGQPGHTPRETGESLEAAF